MNFFFFFFFFLISDFAHLPSADLFFSLFVIVADLFLICSKYVSHIFITIPSADLETYNVGL